MKRYALLVFLLFALAGCAHQGASEAYWLAQGVRPAGEAASLLHYAAYARGLSGVEREKELAAQRNAFITDKSDFRRLQYAFVLGTPAASAAERSRALQLLEPLVDDESGHDADLVALAALQEASLKGQRHGDELERKLNAVKGIERNLMQRGR